MTEQVDRSCDRNCFKCAFQYKRSHGKVLYCTLKNFPILNPEIGCSRQMMKSEFKSKNRFVTAEEIQAATEAKIMKVENNGRNT